jgi:hypothetical protein
VSIDSGDRAADSRALQASETRRLWGWRGYLREHAPGTQVVLRIERAGAAPHDVTIQLAELVP